MAKETYFFSHDYNARNDRKIAALVRDYKAAGYGIFWATCEMMHEEGGHLEFDDLTTESIAKDMNELPSIVSKIITDCVEKYRLFTKQNEAESAASLLHSKRIIRNLDMKNEKKTIKAEAGRLGGIKSGESRRNENILKQNEAVLQSASSIEPKERKGKDIIVKENNIITWEMEKQSFLGSGDYIFRFCTDSGETVDGFDSLAKDFLTQIDLSEDYKSVKELKKHFINWYNSKNKKNGQHNASAIGKKIEFDRP